MGRPFGKREQIAIKKIRITDRTLSRLKDLQQKLGLQTLDETIYYYLPPANEPAVSKPRLFHRAKKNYDVTSQQPNTKLIKEAAKNITKLPNSNNNVNKSTLNHSKDKSVHRNS
jgi:shikimate 5-dehydrogenase